MTKLLKTSAGAVTVLLLAGMLVSTWAQSGPSSNDNAAAPQSAEKQVTLTLVRWPFT